MPTLESSALGCCPDLDTLAAFNRGQLSETSIDGIAEHVSSCPHCASALASLDDKPDDSMVAQLRRCLAEQEYIEEPGCRQLDSRARALLSSASSEERSTLPVQRTGAGADPLIGTRIASYEVVALIRRGGMGKVYRALQAPFQRPVALKMVLGGAHCGPETLARFRREGNAIARLQHPNVVPIYEFGEHDGLPFYSMELMEGGSLADRLAKGPLPVREAAEMLHTLARALAFAHQRQVLHRDLKPGNILLTRFGTPKVSDFGLAKLLDLDETQTRTDAVMGTPAYMAPEQASNTKVAGEAADIYALGIILYECLAGRVPFQGANKVQTLDLLRSCAATPPSHYRRDLPRDLEAVCLKCIEKAPAQRYASAQELAEDLNRWLLGQPTHARPISAAGRLWRRARRHTLALVIGMALLAAWVFFYPRSTVDHLPAIEAELADGKAVTLIGETGMPLWSNVRAGVQTTKLSTADDGTFAVHTWQYCMLELLKDPKHDEYTFSVQVRHERAAQRPAVGVFFAQHTYPGGTEGFRTTMLMSYNDINSISDIAGNSPVKAPRAPLAPQSNINRVRLFPNTYCPLQNKGNDRSSPGVQGVHFEPWRPSHLRPAVWRDLKVVVSASEVEAFWNGQSVGTLTAADIANDFDDSLFNMRRLYPTESWLQQLTPAFQPRGSLGLYVESGSASFRNARIVPKQKNPAQ